MRQNGFTLIELMAVLGITAVLGTFGIAGFVSYNKSQVLQASASEVVTMLSLARSRAQSQIKPSGCSGDLNGYSVVITAPRAYTLYVRCSIGPEIKIDQQDKMLAASLTFNSNTSFFFPIKTGGVQAPAQVTISGYGKSKVVSVNSLGGVSGEPLPTPTPTPIPTSTPTPTPTPFPTPTPTITLPAPIAWWKMNGNTLDSSGNGYNGITSATPTAGNDAYIFDGIDDYFSVNAAGVEVAAAFSMGAWIKPDTVVPSYQLIMGKPTEWTRSLFLSNGQLRSYVVHNTVNANSDSVGSIISAGVWQHVFVVLQTGRLYLYKNGAEVAYSVQALGVGAPTSFLGNLLYIGGYNGADQFDGVIDDVRIYNTVLTQPQINSIYLLGRQ